MKVIEDEEVIYRILAHLHLLAPGDGPRAPPRSAGLRELIYEPVFDLPAVAACLPSLGLSAVLAQAGDRQAQTGDLAWLDPA